MYYVTSVTYIDKILNTLKSKCYTKEESVTLNNKKLAKDYIVEAFLQLLKKQKFEDITITDIANKAGITRVTFYRNFNSKEEIIKNHLDNITDEFIKTSKILYNPNDFKNYIIKLFTHLENNKDIGILLYKAKIFYFLEDEFNRIFFTKATNKVEEYHYAFISGGLYNTYYYWIKNSCKETPQELAEIFNNFYILKGDSN